MGELIDEFVMLLYSMQRWQQLLLQDWYYSIEVFVVILKNEFFNQMKFNGRIQTSIAC